MRAGRGRGGQGFIFKWESGGSPLWEGDFDGFRRGGRESQRWGWGERPRRRKQGGCQCKGPEAGAGLTMLEAGVALSRGKMRPEGFLGGPSSWVCFKGRVGGVCSWNGHGFGGDQGQPEWKFRLGCVRSERCVR